MACPLRNARARRCCGSGGEWGLTGDQVYNVRKRARITTLIRVNFRAFSAPMTLLANHPQRSEIRERLLQNIVLRRLAPEAFDELEGQLAIVDYRKGDVLLSQGAHDMEQYFVLDGILRSEEHTSELQSPDHLVCRLLLEKKKRST